MQSNTKLPLMMMMAVIFVYAYQLSGLHFTLHGFYYL